MTISCSQCGAVLADGNAFCTKCGARRFDAAQAVAARRFCTKCGVPLPGQTKFCTNCGAAAGLAPGVPASTATSGGASGAKTAATVSSSATTGAATQPAASAAPTAKSPAGIPKVAIVGGTIVVALILVVAIAGFIHAAHRARQKATAAKAAYDLEKNLANFGATGNAAAQKANGQSPADINRNLADLAAAANAIAQNAQKQGGTNPPSAIPGVAGAASGSTSTPTSTPFSSASPAQIAAGSAAVNAALTPAPSATPIPIVPVADTGNQAHDWALEYERTAGGPEADLVVRTGDINNLGFGWPHGFDPFSGQSTPPHQWPRIDHIPPKAPDGTDRIMLGTSVMPVHMVIQHTAGQPDQIMIDWVGKHIRNGDGYSGALYHCFEIRNGLPSSMQDQLPDSVRDQRPLPIYLEVPIDEAAACTPERQLTMPTPIVLPVGALPSKIDTVVLQIFADDFQPVALQSHFQVSLNGTRIPSFEYAINALDQTGPIGKLLTLKLLPEYWPLLKSGTVKLLIDDPTTHVPDGYAVDFVRILVNPHKFKYQVELTVAVTDADNHRPIADATVSAGLESAATDRVGKYQFKGLPAGLVIATANAPGYDESSVPVDLPVGQSGNADIQLHRHQESTAALEQSIVQTGTATIYGIHFDTGSSKLRADSMPALNAVLGLINGRPGSNWIIAGHTDNQGSDALNIPLSKARAASVISWLTAHGVASDRLGPQGFGSTRPVADNTTANGRALNRRVEVALAK